MVWRLPLDATSRRSHRLSEKVHPFASSVLRTVRDVLAYFLQNPSATDSLEGIARWRVQQETISHIVEQVDQALAWLVDHRLLVREERVGVAPMFRLDPARTSEAERLLRDIDRNSGAAGPGGSDAPVLSEEPAKRVTDHQPTPLLTKALAWVDAALLRYHRRHEPGGSDLPGLTRSHASRRVLLDLLAIPFTTSSRFKSTMNEYRLNIRSSKHSPKGALEITANSDYTNRRFRCC